MEERTHRAEAERRRVAEEGQVALREHLREAVARERQNWEQKEEKRWRAQLTSLKENAKKTIEQLERTVVKQDETLQSQSSQIGELRKVRKKLDVLHLCCTKMFHFLLTSGCNSREYIYA